MDILHYIILNVLRLLIHLQRQQQQVGTKIKYFIGYTTTFLHTSDLADQNNLIVLPTVTSPTTRLHVRTPSDAPKIIYFFS